MNNGGPAFPQPFAGDERGMYTSAEKDPSNAGMSMRDYFAAAALTGDLAASVNARERPDPADLAAYAYSVADAMLAAREEET